eukprot:jgi/Hompol1/2265/HPOL_005918-RA
MHELKSSLAIIERQRIHIKSLGSNFDNNRTAQMPVISDLTSDQAHRRDEVGPFEPTGSIDQRQANSYAIGEDRIDDMLHEIEVRNRLYVLQHASYVSTYY